VKLFYSLIFFFLLSGCCYPYVKIYLLPEIKFLGVVQPRTRTQKNTVFPLFEETFVM